MRAAPIVGQLGGLGLVTVGGALEFAALRKAPVPRAMPAGFVIADEKAPSGNRREGYVGAIDQKVKTSFWVALLLDGATRVGDSLVSDQIADLVGDATSGIVGRLLGWTMPGASGPILYAGERLMWIDHTVVCWGVQFTTPSHLRKVE